MFHVMAYSESGNKHDPVAFTCHELVGESSATPTTAAAPSAKSELATSFLGSQP
jgi:hypothetical protein